MSVLNCSRKDCENIMCDRYVDGYGYICNECYSELLETSPKNEKDVILFLETSKKSTKYLDENGHFDINKYITSIY